jgi:hypothetical protein
MPTSNGFAARPSRLPWQHEACLLGLLTGDK